MAEARGSKKERKGEAERDYKGQYLKSEGKKEGKGEAERDYERLVSQVWREKGNGVVERKREWSWRGKGVWCRRYIRKHGKKQGERKGLE